MIFVEKSVELLHRELTELERRNDEYAKGAIHAINWFLSKATEPSKIYAPIDVTVLTGK